MQLTWQLHFKKIQTNVHALMVRLTIFKNIQYFLQCLQFVRLFRVAICRLDNMKNFSVIHKLQCFVAFVYALAFARIFHEIVYPSFFSFSFHRCFFRSVSFHLFSCLRKGPAFVIAHTFCALHNRRARH